MSTQAARPARRQAVYARSLEMPPFVATGLSVVALIVLYSGLAYFRQSATQINLGQVVNNPFHPRYAYLLFVVYSIGSILFPNRYLQQRRLPTALFWACAVFDLYLLVQLLFVPDSDMFWFGYRFEFMIMLPAYIVVLGSVPRPEVLFRVLRWVVIAQSILYLFLFLRPHAFPLLMEFGRVAGFWGNPNEAAFMIAGAVPLAALGMKPAQRALLYAITLAGVLATLSRGGLVLWAEMVLLSAFFRMERTNFGNRSERIVYAGGIGIVAVFGSVLANLNIVGWLASLSSTNVARLSTTRDYSVTERLYVIYLAWEKFKQHPIFGNGVGYTVHWGYSASTHNMFMLILVEHGVAGLVLLLGWILSLLSFAGVTRLWVIGYFVTVSLFSHNIFEAEYAIQFAMYWLAAYCLNAKGEKTPVGSDLKSPQPAAPAALTPSRI